MVLSTANQVGYCCLLKLTNIFGYCKLDLEIIMANNNQLKQQIALCSNICGISSDEVAFAKSMVENKCKDKTLFVCEGLWAVDKLIEKKNRYL